VKINEIVGPDVISLKRPEIQKPFDEAKARYYQNVDWALDIRDAQVKVLEINGVPSHLIRRDPETQVIVSRNKLYQPDWREKLDPSNYWFDYLEGCAWGGPEVRPSITEYLLVTPRNVPWKEFEKILSDLKELRKIGLVDPD
jgi:hypothetical protein